MLSLIFLKKAKMLRENMTEAEQRLWEYLKGKKVMGLRFRPQHPIDIFIADFYCHPLKLVVEVDGGIHKLKDRAEYDIGREAELKGWGIKVVRFTNEEIERDLDLVRDEIIEICKSRRSEFQSPLQGI
jgi:very-short-patch-repair endonuclease